MGEVRSSAHLFLQKTGRIMFKINGAETAFTLASLAFCAIHWLVERSFSIRLVLSALLLGAIAATLAAWLSDTVLSLIRATMKPPKYNRPADFDDVDQCLRRPNAMIRRTIDVIFRQGRILVALLAIGGIYVAYPYVTLYRLDMALRSGDVTTLQMLVDWPAVREGITEDICDLVIDQSAESKAGSELPPFGTGFVRGITTNRVTERVVPQAFVALAGEPLAGETKDLAAISVHWAFFDGPTQFSVHLRTSRKVPPTRLQMELRNGLWKITRIWLPLEMLGDLRAI